MFSRSRRNLACWFALSMGSILIVFAGVVYHREVEDQIQAFDKLLYRKASDGSSSRYSVLSGSVVGQDAGMLDSEWYARWYSNEQLVRGCACPTLLSGTWLSNDQDR